MAAPAMPKTAHKFKRLLPLFNRILIKRADPAKETKAGIVLPEGKNKSYRGTVIAVGPGTKNENGVQIPMTIKVGDEVMLPDYGGTKVELEDQTFFIYRETEILGKYSD